MLRVAGPSTASVSTNQFNPHSAPPKDLRAVFTRFKHLPLQDIFHDEDLVDFSLKDEETLSQKGISRVGQVTVEQLLAANDALGIFLNSNEKSQNSTPRTVWAVENIPGLRIIPSLLSTPVSKILVSRLLHRDLGDTRYKTNLHLHHKIPNRLSNAYTSSETDFEGLSWFRSPPSDELFAEPIDANAHKPLSVSQVLKKKLRWITLGGQYDWTAKRYPDEQAPMFPIDIAHFTTALFQDVQPEAAILNLYSPGDTLSLHRDVSEDCDRPLVSLSLGCDGIFIVGLEEAATIDADGTISSTDELVDACEEGDESIQRTTVVWTALRLRSGDAVCMSGPSRFAWHGVPKIIPETCPSWLSAWPADDEKPGNSFEAWRGWMADKRLNLNIRQMRESTT